MFDKNIDKLLFFLFLTMLSCSSVNRVVPSPPEFKIQDKTSLISNESILFCSYFLSDEKNETLCMPLAFFPDGTLFSGSQLFNINTVSDYFSREGEALYGKDFGGWGRYNFEKDTVQYEWAKRYNLGLINRWFPLIEKEGFFLSADSLLIKTASELKGQRLPFKLRDSVMYYRVEYPDVKNIQPNKAWINK